MPNYKQQHERVYRNRDWLICFCGQQVAVYHKDCLALLTPEGDIPRNEPEATEFDKFRSAEEEQAFHWQMLAEMYDDKEDI